MAFSEYMNFKRQKNPDKNKGQTKVGKWGDKPKGFWRVSEKQDGNGVTHTHISFHLTKKWNMEA